MIKIPDTLLNMSDFQVPTKRSQGGLELPILGNGTWGVGGFFEPSSSVDEVSRAFEGLKLSIERGLRHIETAEAYARGETEKIIGRVIKHFDREDLTITSKVLDTNLSYEGVHTSVDGILKRLNTDYLDLCMVHGPNDEISLSETLTALLDLKSRGAIRHIGLSNFNVTRLKEAEKIAPGEIEVASSHYNLLHQEVASEEIVRYCQEHGMLFLAWRPLEKGTMVPCAGSVMEDLAKKYGSTTTQIMLSWLTSQPQIVTVVKALSPIHIEENIRATSLDLLPDEISLLKESFPGRILRPEKTFLI